MDPLPHHLRLLRLVIFAGAFRNKSDIIGYDGADIDAALGALTDAGLIECAGIIIPTPAGLEAMEQWYAADRRELNSADRNALLERFRPLDRELKRIASAWQEAAARDDWDRRLESIEALSALHENTLAYIDQAPASLSRFADFRRRLERAHAGVINGETDFFVGVRCDSYHTIWFQFHEDLLRLLQRERDAE
jgi:hypothetical protein